MIVTKCEAGGGSGSRHTLTALGAAPGSQAYPNTGSYLRRQKRRYAGAAQEPLLGAGSRFPGALSGGRRFLGDREPSLEPFFMII